MNNKKRKGQAILSAFSIDILQKNICNFAAQKETTGLTGFDSG